MDIDRHTDQAGCVRAVLRAVARMIGSDRRAVVLATDTAEVLLANAPANRLGLDTAYLLAHLDWAGLCVIAKRAGSTPLSFATQTMDLEGELVFVPVGEGAAYLLRLAESEQEAMWLRNRARAATLMRVAHDLRTPIQSLLASVDALVTQSSKAGRHAKQVRNASDLALDHIAEVLAVVRGEQARGGVQPDQVFSLPDALESLVEIIRPMAVARGVDLRVTIRQDVDYQVVGPLRYVRALFQNLIDNAVKYGGTEVAIQLSVTPLAKSLDSDLAHDALGVTLEIADCGSGMPDAQKARLGAVAGASKPQGAGKRHALPNPRPSGGMEVIAHAVTQLGGRIEILDRGADGAPLSHTDPAHAATVTGTLSRVTFPLLLAQGASADTASMDSKQAGQAAQTQDLADLRLVLIEDSPVSRDWLAHILRAAGAEVTAFANGTDALMALMDGGMINTLDLILTDITLPDMTGIALSRAIGKLVQVDPRPEPTLVMGLTAHVDEKVRLACRRAGMVQVLEKPIRPAALCAAVRAAVQARVPRDSAPAPQQQPDQTAAAAPGLFDAAVISSLTSAFGMEGAKKYMVRALEEGRNALRFVRDNAAGPAAKSVLHGATGACGLTGLSIVAEKLRGLEKKVEAGSVQLDAEMEALEVALAQTSDAIAVLDT